MGYDYLNKNCKFEYSYFFWTILIGYMKMISIDIENLREKNIIICSKSFYQDSIRKAIIKKPLCKFFKKFSLDI